MAEGRGCAESSATRMCWVAIDRALRLANRRSFPAPFSRWYEARDSIYRDIYERFWDASRCGFVQHPGASTFDAAALLMPLVRFVSPTDPRWIDTLRGIERELVSDSLVYRYRLGESFSDGLTGQEGTFSMAVRCSTRSIRRIRISAAAVRAQGSASLTQV